MKRLKQTLWAALKALAGIVAAAVVTNLITGQPLTGLVRLKGLYQSFITAKVPAWAFAVVLLLLLVCLYYLVPHIKPHGRGKIHFHPDAYNNGWSIRATGEMDVIIGGTLTYEGSGPSLEILKVFLKNTTPTNDLHVQVEFAGLDRPLSTGKIWLPSGRATDIFTSVTLKPAIGTKGQPLRARLVLRDKFNRDFVLDPVEFRYTGQG